MMIRLVMIAATACTLANAETDPWTPLRVFVGAWEGPASGEPGKGTATRTYAFELNDSFLVARNKSVYEPKFVSQRIENIAPGWRAKEAYRVISEDELDESFSLANPGKDFELYSRTLLKRIK